jgi:hypothetical protein
MVFDLAVQAYSKTAWAVPHQRYAVRFRCLHGLEKTSYAVQVTRLSGYSPQ